MNKIISFALVAITVMMLAFTTTMTGNVNASSMEQHIEQDIEANPNGEKVIDTQSNENSEKAAVEIERSIDHSVKQEPSDEPAHTSTRTVEKGDTTTIIEKRSAPQSSAAASQIENESEVENEDNID